jgi:hypothetical protein
MIFDPRSNNSYSVIDVAGIAAGCEGMTPKHRIFEALDLIAAAEEVAGYSPDQILEFSTTRHIPLMTPGSGILDLLQAAKHLEASRAKWTRRVSKIVANCDRDSKTKRIKRTSLVHQTFMASGNGKNPKYAQERFGTFVECVIESQHGAAPELTQEHFLNQFETGAKTKLLKSDSAAVTLADHFLQWLESSKPGFSGSSMDRLHSKLDRKFVSKKTKGALRDAEGKFSPS